MNAPALALLAALLPPGPSTATPPPTPRPDLASGLELGREGLARYQWRLKTEMKVDGLLRLTKVEDVHLGPDGGLVMKKTVRYDKRPEPTPFPPNDPRGRDQRLLTSDEEEKLADAASDVMQLYARLSPEVVRRWQESAELLPPDPDGAPGPSEGGGGGSEGSQSGADLVVSTLAGAMGTPAAGARVTAAQRPSGENATPLFCPGRAENGRPSRYTSGFPRAYPVQATRPPGAQAGSMAMLPSWLTCTWSGDAS